MRKSLYVLAVVALLGCSGKKEEAPKAGPECEKARACCAELSKTVGDVDSICDKAKTTTVEFTCSNRRRAAIELAQVKGATIPELCR